MGGIVPIHRLQPRLIGARYLNQLRCARAGLWFVSEFLSGSAAACIPVVIQQASGMAETIRYGLLHKRMSCELAPTPQGWLRPTVLLRCHTSFLNQEAEQYDVHDEENVLHGQPFSLRQPFAELLFHRSQCKKSEDIVQSLGTWRPFPRQTHSLALAFMLHSIIGTSRSDYCSTILGALLVHIMHCLCM